MIWILLILAGLLEVLGVTLINQFHRDRKWTTLVAMISGFALSFYLLSVVMTVLPMATTYAIWTGIGAAGGAIVGMLFYGEQKDRYRIFFITIILFSTIALKFIA